MTRIINGVGNKKKLITDIYQEHSNYKSTFKFTGNGTYFWMAPSPDLNPTERQLYLRPHTTSLPDLAILL